MVGPCAAHIPVHRIPAHVAIIRHGRNLNAPGARTRNPRISLQAGDGIVVAPPATFSFSFAGNSFRVPHGRFQLECAGWLRRCDASPSAESVLASFGLQSRTGSSSAPGARRVTPSFSSRETAHVRSTPPPRQSHSPSAATRRRPDPGVDPAQADHRGEGFGPVAADQHAHHVHRDLRPTAACASTSGRSRSRDSSARRPRPIGSCRTGPTGCPAQSAARAPGAIPGWPLKPFHQQHAIRAGINELRPANFHVAVDIEASNFQPVYAIQSGYATIRYPGTGDVNVDVGRFYYWHINPAVGTASLLSRTRPRSVRVLHGFGHVALSEGTTSDYLNPLQAGRQPAPVSRQRAADHRGPAGLRRRAGDRRRFDPQSIVQTGAIRDAGARALLARVAAV